MNHYSRLTREQRYTLEAMKRNGASQKEIAAAIGKHPSTVSREFRRAGMTSVSGVSPRSVTFIFVSRRAGGVWIGTVTAVV